jgi:transposase-like protein
MVTCPFCGKDAKPTGKEFKFGVFNGKSHYCKECEKPFNAFYRSDKFSHTVPKPKH